MERELHQKLEIAQEDLDTSELNKVLLEQKFLALLKYLHLTSESINEKEKVITKTQDEEEQIIAESKKHKEIKFKSKSMKIFMILCHNSNI